MSRWDDCPRCRSANVVERKDEVGYMHFEFTRTCQDCGYAWLSSVIYAPRIPDLNPNTIKN